MSTQRLSQNITAFILLGLMSSCSSLKQTPAKQEISHLEENPITMKEHVITGEWQQISFLTEKQKIAGRTVGGEGGQQMTGIAYAQSNPMKLLAGIDVAGTWLSDNGGKNWSICKGDMLPNKMGAGVAIDPKNENIFYAWAIGEKTTMTQNIWKGLYRSLDAGLHWVQVSPPNSCPASTGKGQVSRFIFVADTEKDQVLKRTASMLTCDRNKIFLSTDGGTTFSQFGKEFADTEMPNFAIIHIYLLRKEPLSILTATTNGLFLVSADTTLQWGENLPKGLPVTGLTQHPKSPHILWAVVDKRLFKSIDNGETFDEIITNGIKFERIFVDRVNGSTLYNPVAYNLIYVSHDGGYSWSAGIVDESLCSRHSGGWTQGFACHPSDPQTALMCFGDRVFITRDAGRIWTDSSTGWSGTRSVLRNSFYFHPTDDKVVGIGSLDWGFFYSVNGGDTWRYCWAQGVPRYRSILGLLLDPRSNWQTSSATAGPQRILAYSGGWNGSMQTLIRSEDGGAWQTPAEGKQTWIVYDEIRRKGRAVAYNMKHEGMVYMGQMKSLDWGVTWKEMAQPVDAYCHSNPDILYSIHKYDDGDGLMISKDCGETWETTQGRLKTHKIKDIDVAPDNPECVYAATDNGIGIWQKGVWTLRGLESGLTHDGFGAFNFSSIAVDPKNTKRVYAGAWTDYFGNSSGVWASFDGGTTWGNISYNLGAMSIWAVTVNPHNGSVYIGTSYGHWVLKENVIRR